MSARGSQVMQFVPAEIAQVAVLPGSPSVGQLVQYQGVTPNELLMWTGNSANPTQRRYAASMSGAAVVIPDLSDDHALDVTVKTVAARAGTGTPSPTNIRAIAPAVVAGNGLMAWTAGKNLIGVSDWLRRSFSVGLPTTENTNVTISDSGKNTVVFSLASGSNAGVVTNLIYLPAGTYTISFDLSGSIVARVVDYAGGYTNYRGAGSVTTGAVSYTITTTGWPIALYFFSTFVQANISIANLQVASVASDTAFEVYQGQKYDMPVQQPMYGRPGLEDERRSDGCEVHKTAPITLTGVESWTLNGTYTANGFRTFYTLSRAPGCVTGVVQCSHLPPVYANTTAATLGIHTESGGILAVRIPEAIATTPTALQAWIAAQMTAGTPVQGLYDLATPMTVTNAPTPINGVDGTNTVTSNGASLVVSYTGSGWVALGAVQRVAVESVSITPEQGLRVDTVLQSSDGAHQVPTYFNARGAKYGLFRASDGVMILGGMVLPNGRPAGVAGALVSPGSTGETRIEIETTSEGSGQTRVDTAALHLIQPSLEGASDVNPAPTGEKVPVWFEAARTTLVDGTGHYIDNYKGAIKALGSLRLIALSEGGQELAWLMLEHTSEGGLLHTGGAYSASDPERTLSNFAPRIQMSAPTGESIVYNSTAQRYMLDWKTIEDDYGRFETFKGGNLSARDVGIVILVPGYYRFVFHVDLEQASSSSGAVLHINRMPFDWSPPSNRNYCTDADLTPSSGPTRIAYRRAASAPLNASTTTCELVADMWCADGDRILPVAAMAAASKTLVSAGTFFSAQKIG